MQRDGRKLEREGEGDVEEGKERNRDLEEEKERGV